MFTLAAQKTAVRSRPEVEVGREGGRGKNGGPSAVRWEGKGWLGVGEPSEAASGAIFLNFEVWFAALDAEKNIVLFNYFFSNIDFLKIFNGVPPEQLMISGVRGP